MIGPRASVRELVEINIFAAQTFRLLIPFEDDLLTVIGHCELFADVTLFAMAQDVVEPIHLHVQRTVKVLRLGCRQRDPFVEALQEAGQERVACVHVAYVLKPQFLDQAILQGAVRSFHAALGLAGVCADNLDVQLGKSAAELRHAGPTLRVAVDPKDRVLVRVEGYRTNMSAKIAL